MFWFNNKLYQKRKSDMTISFNFIDRIILFVSGATNMQILQYKLF